MDKNVPRAHHDLGGAPKFMCEPVDIEPHALTDFDKEVDALRQILGMKKIMTVAFQNAKYAGRDFVTTEDIDLSLASGQPVLPWQRRQMTKDQ